jgi:hypothetical protein
LLQPGAVSWFHTVPVLPGDYQARLLKDSPKKSAYKEKDPHLNKEYEAVMPDQTLLTSAVTGIAE